MPSSLNSSASLFLIFILHQRLEVGQKETVMVTHYHINPSFHTAHLGWGRPKGFLRGAQRGHLIRSWLAGPWGGEQVYVTRTASGWHLGAQKWPLVPGVTQLGLLFTWYHLSCTLFSGQEWQSQDLGKTCQFPSSWQNIAPRETPNHLFRNLPTLILFLELPTVT